MNSLDLLVERFSKLPGVGRKSALRIAYHLLTKEKSYAEKLGQSILDLHDAIRPCSVCGNYTETDPCPICSDPLRERQLICVVEQPKDVFLINSAGDYKGLFFVLNGVLSPLDGVGPDQLGLPRLFNRIQSENVQEVVIATNPTVQGDSTALYIQQMVKDLNVSVSRIATGLPVGGDLEYADPLSIVRAFKARTEI